MTMTPDTLFQSALRYTTKNLSEGKDFIEARKQHIYSTFASELAIEKVERQFVCSAEGRSLRFTENSFLRFCAAIGIPRGFAIKIPDDLLLKAIDTLLGSSNFKLHFIIRDGNVIGDLLQKAHAEPLAFLEIADELTKEQQLREMSIGDNGTLLLFEPYSDQTIYPAADDPYNVGAAFHLGCRPGLLEAVPYSMRHACGNIAITRTTNPKNTIAERLMGSSKNKLDYYRRLLERYTPAHYREYKEEIYARLARCSSAEQMLVESQYEEIFKALDKLVGKEIAWAWIDVNEDEHKEILSSIKLKKVQQDSAGLLETPAKEGLTRYDVFNRITAGAAGYDGLERVALQTIGGALI